MYGIYAMAASGRMQYDYNNNNNMLDSLHSSKLYSHPTLLASDASN